MSENVGKLARRSMPDTQREFGGVEYQLADTSVGYVYKKDSRMLHTADCSHEPSQHIEDWDQERVVAAWHNTPDMALAELTDLRWCGTCVARPVRLAEETNTQIGTVAKAARVVLEHLLGDQRSVIEPGRVIWTAEHAEYLRSAIEDHLDLGSRSFFEKLQGQLADAPREVVLLAAEIIYLRGVPLENVTPAKKRDHVQTILSWLSDVPPIPTVMEEGTHSGGSFHGGQGYNQQLWKQMVWLARFTIAWDNLANNDRAKALEDPWRFRSVVAHLADDLPAIRNAFLFMAFPAVFESIINDDHKVNIRDAFAHIIDGATGTTGEAIDRDLLTIRTKLEADTSEAIDWYSDPWENRWRNLKNIGDRAWAVRTKPADPELIDKWLEEGFVSLAATHLGPLTPDTDRVNVREAISSGYDHLDYTQRMYLTDDYFAFLSRMKQGDIVATQHDDRVWIGRITGPAAYSEELPRLRRNVDWRESPFEFSELPAPLPKLLGSSGSVVDLTEAQKLLEKLVSETSETLLVETPTDVSLSLDATPTLRRATIEFAEKLHLETGWLNTFIEVLEARRQVIVHGPPGTGKTYVSRILARYVAGDDAVQIVQFHPSYAYEDFFEGYRPTPQADGGIGFQLQPGPLRRIASLAESDPGTPYVLIIDEINRANIAKVFGELYFLLEYRGEKIGLQYSPDELFGLPKNLFVIGTMNTADRSTALVDTAIRRRFSFIEMHPDSEPIAGLLGRWLTANNRPHDRAHLLAALNHELGESNRDFLIGPSYLMRDEAKTDVGLASIWRHDILPLLEEHFYGQLSAKQVADRFGLHSMEKAAKKEQLAGAATAADDEGPTSPEAASPQLLGPHGASGPGA